MANVNVPGLHLPFLSDDRTRGGHLMSCVPRKVRVGIQYIRRMELALPITLDYLTQDFTRDAAKDLDEMKKLAGSYEALFSRVAMKYRSMGLTEMKLTEKDYRKYILEEYTFLKRPVMVNGDRIFIGNAAKVVAEAKTTL